MNRELHIDVFFDLVCPWCFIGKRQLSKAVARLSEAEPDVQVSLRWHSVQLIPQVPDAGLPYVEFYDRRLGSRSAVQARQAQVKAAAAQAGIDIDFAAIAVFPNTRRAHHLIALARRLDAAAVDPLLERLFAAFFQRGEDIGDPETLAAIAAELGLPPDATRAALEDRSPLPESPQVPGVPFFIFNRATATSGAQPAEVLLDAMIDAMRAQA
jgi:predicted DsbA family dithiol-disulfide isomerase